MRIDPLTLITDMRRNRVGEGELIGTAATALRRMQSSANPWGLPAAERANWSEGIGAPTVKENPGFELLYWIGCAGSYDRRAQRVARAVVKLLKHANVNFANPIPSHVSDQREWIDAHRTNCYARGTGGA